METRTIDIQNLLAGRLRVGVNLFWGMRIKEASDLENHINESLAGLRRTGLAEPPPGFAYSRRLYRAFHIDPTRYRPSSEALWRRFKKNGEFQRVHPLVDLTNLLSLVFQVPYGLYDLDRIKGSAVTITIGDESDTYQGIRKELLHFTGKIVLRDDSGAFGNPSSDSLGTAVGPETQNILQAIFFHPDDPVWNEIQAETIRTCSMFFSCSKVDRRVV